MINGRARVFANAPNLKVKVMTAVRKDKKMWVVLALSFIPGLSLLYLGKVRKSVPILVIDLGIAAGFLFSGSYLLRLLLFNVYLVTFWVPCMESYQLVKYGVIRTDARTRWYVVVLLLTTGFNAIPLLWQSDKFTKKGKIAWTIAVPVLFVAFFGFLIRYWERGEMLIRNVLGVGV